MEAVLTCVATAWSAVVALLLVWACFIPVVCGKRKRKRDDDKGKTSKKKRKTVTKDKKKGSKTKKTNKEVTMNQTEDPDLKSKEDYHVDDTVTGGDAGKSAEGEGEGGGAGAQSAMFESSAIIQSQVNDPNNNASQPPPPAGIKKQQGEIQAVPMSMQINQL